MKGLPIISDIYYNKDGSIYDVKGSFKFKALSNRSNVLFIHLEDGYVDNEILLINFTPNNANRIYTTHWFRLTPLGLNEYKKEGDNRVVSFYTYSIEIPEIILNNQNKTSDVTNIITLIKRYGVTNLGYFDEISELPPATKELKRTNAFAVVLREVDAELNGIYQVTYEDGNFVWELRNETASYGGTQKQYATKDIYVQKGYQNPQGMAPISTVITQLVMQSLSSVEAHLNKVLNNYVASINFIDTDTLETIVTKTNQSVLNVIHNVKVDNEENELLEVGEDGFFVKHDDEKVDKMNYDDGVERVYGHLDGDEIDIPLVYYVKKTTKVNNKTLDNDIELTSLDIKVNPSMIDEKTLQTFVDDMNTDMLNVNNELVRIGDTLVSGGGGNSNEPDGITIVLNEEDKLKVSEKLEIDGGFL